MRPKVCRVYGLMQRKPISPSHVGFSLQKVVPRVINQKLKYHAVANSRMKKVLPSESSLDVVLVTTKHVKHR